MRQRSWFWPCFALFIALVGVGGTGALIYSATADRSFGVEPDYYRKALSWNQIAAQHQRNTALGWRISLDTSATPGLITADIQDASANPVASAIVTAIAFANARSSDRIDIPFRESAPGRYTASIPSGAHGLWHYRLEVTRAHDTFTWEGDLQFDAPDLEVLP